MNGGDPGMRLAAFIQRRKDMLAGALVFMFGVSAMNAGLSYGVGTLSRMGAGFFPMAVGAILAMTGLAIAFTRQPVREAAVAAPHPPEWRGWSCILLGLVCFVVLGRYGGLMPATFAIVFVSALGDRQNTVVQAAVLALVMCVACAVVFWWALRMQMPLFTFGG